MHLVGLGVVVERGLLDAAATTQDLALALQLACEASLDKAKGVHVLELGLGAEGTVGVAYGDVGVAAELSFSISASETPTALRMSLSWLAVALAASGDGMSGSVTISIKGVPPRLKSTRPTEPCMRPEVPTCTFFAASSSRWSRVMPTRILPSG